MLSPPEIAFHRPETLAQALEIKAEHPVALPLAGGTDLMVELNFRRRQPGAILDLTAVPELTGWAPEDGRLRVGAGVTYTRLIEELGDRLPGLAIASRTVGSPQIRNRGTVGGNLATASPAGDAPPRRRLRRLGGPHADRGDRGRGAGVGRARLGGRRRDSRGRARALRRARRRRRAADRRRPRQ